MTERDEKESLRICLIGPAYPYRGGISHYNTCLARELQKKHTVRVVNYSRLYPEFLFPGRTQYDESESPHKVESERLIDSINPLTWIRAAFNIARFDPDLVVVQWWHPYFAPALGKICGILRMMGRGTVVFLCHNVVPHERSAIDRMLSQAAFLTARGFIVQSKEDRDDLLRIRRRAPVMVHPHPIYDFFRMDDMSREEARKEIGAGEGRILLFFGYIRPYKGLEYLLRAMPGILEEMDAVLYVVGEFYEDSSRYRRYVEENGLAEKVVFVDRYVDNREVGKYFTAADLVVLPYISATQSGIAQISIAFDRPMVVTGVGGLPEVVREGRTGFVVPPRDSRSIKSAVVRFFSEGWSQRMASNFDSEKERFSWGAMVSALERFYNEIR